MTLYSIFLKVCLYLHLALCFLGAVWPVWADEEAIVLMGDQSLRPYEYLSNGMAIGANIDLIQMISKELNRPIEVRLMKWAEAQERTNNGEANGLTFAAKNRRRAEAFDFSVPTFSTTISLFVEASDADNALSQSLTGKRIGVTKGGFPRILMEDRHPDTTLVIIQNALDGFRRLRDKIVDGVVIDTWVGYNTLHQNDIETIKVARVIHRNDVHIALRKGQQQLLDDINLAILSIKDSGKFDGLINKWSGQRIFLFSKKEINIYLLTIVAAFFALLTIGTVIYVFRIRKHNRLLTMEIAERKKAEESIRDNEQKLFESEAKYRHLYETMSQGVVIQDTEGSVIEANHAACELLGLTMEQMLGKTAYDPRWKLIHEDGSSYDPSEMPSNIVLRTGKPSKVVHCGIYVPEKDGYRWIVIGSVPRFKDGETKPFITTTVFTDITEFKNLEARLQQAQKMEFIGTLAGGIAHDFNNILSSIIGFTELALGGAEKGTELEDDLQEVRIAGLRAKDLVKQILTFARQSDETVKPIQVNVIAEEVLKFIKSSIPSTIQINTKIISDSFIMGSSTQVHQILMNLCTNAAHAMEEKGGILDVSVNDISIGRNASPNLKLGEYIELKVTDTGMGISPKNIHTIFEPYFTTKSVGEGTGMGLAVVHGIVEKYGGQITVDSTIGEGSCFKIYLPITKKRKLYTQSEIEDFPLGDESILFVDDEASIAKMGSKVLEQLGYSVTTRTSSVEALELFRTKPQEFDLVLTDMTMPDMTGDKLAIKLMKIRSNIPVIICTGYSKKITKESSAKLGIMGFVNKPVVKADLATTIRKVLDKANSSE